MNGEHPFTVHAVVLSRRLAGGPRLPGLDLALEPIDLVLDGLPRRLGGEPVQRAGTLFLREYRRGSQSLIKRDLLLGGGIGAWANDRFGAAIPIESRARA